MQRIPISRAVRATRIAISPRFAIRSRRNIRSPSQRDIAVLLGRPGLSFRAEDGEGVDPTRSGLRRFDHVIEVAHPRGDVRVREALAVVADEFLLLLPRIVGGFEFSFVDNLNGLLRSHDGELRRRPCEVEITADVFGAHHVVRTTVGLSGDDRDLRHSGLAEGEQKLRAVSDDPAVFLLRPWEESWNIHEREKRDIEAVAEPDEASRLNRRVDVERARADFGLVPNYAGGSTLQAREAHHDVLRPFFLDLEP